MEKKEGQWRKNINVTSIHGKMFEYIYISKTHLINQISINIYIFLVIELFRDIYSQIKDQRFFLLKYINKKIAVQHFKTWKFGVGFSEHIW